MFKWFLIVAAAALVVTFTIWQRNSVKTSYINGLVQYNKLPGREFILERDCYIFKLASHPTEYPLIGAQKTVAALPAEVDAKLIGTALPGARLLDTVTAGTRFKIVSVRRDEHRTHTDITFEILLLEEADHKYPRVDAFFIIDHAPEQNGQAPLVREDFAVARIR